MADKTLKVTLDAKDNASATFAKVGNSAQTMGQAIAKSGDAATKSMDKTAMSAEDMQRALDQGYKAGQQIGIGLLALGAASAAAGKMFRDQQVAIDTLQRGYGDAADEMLSFADAMQQSTNFSNDAVIGAANSFRTLRENYGYTADQIQQLISISADLAASMGIGLEDAATRVQSAMRGEAEAAEYLGLTLNDHALGIDKLSTSTSEYEKSQIRLAALTEQAAFAQGAAAQQADTTYGSLTRLGNGVQDLIQDYGGFLGIVGEFGAFMADHPAQMLAAAAAMKALQVAVVGVKGAYSQLNSVGAIAPLVGVLTGPAGLVVAAGAAAVGVGLLAKSLMDDLPRSSAAALQSMQELKSAAIDLGVTGTTISVLNQAQAQVATNNTLIDQYRDHLTDFGIVLQQLEDQLPLGGEEPLFDIDASAFDELRATEVTINGVRQTLADAVDTNHDAQISYTELKTAIETLGEAGYDVQPLEMALASLVALNPDLETLSDTMAGIPIDNEMFDGLRDLTIAVDGVEQSWLSYIDTNHDAMLSSEELRAGIASLSTTATDAQRYNQALTDATTDMNTVLAATGPLADEVRANLAALITGLLNGTVAPETFAAGVHGLVTFLDMAKTSAAEAAVELSKFGQIVRTMTTDVAEVVVGLAEGVYQFEMFGNAAGDAAVELGTFGQITKTMATDIANVVVGLADGVYQFEMFGKAAAKGFGDPFEHMADWGESLDGFDAAAAKADELRAKIAEDFAAIQTTLNGTTEALNSGFRVAVGNTDAIAKQSQAVADWAEELIGAEGVYSRIDELLVRNGALTTAATLSLDDYAAAQDAYNDIQRENAEIQQDIAVIQAQQAPIMAVLMAQQENYLQSLAEKGPEQQQFALAMMDSATAAKALDLATGLLSENGDVFAPMAESLANLNPYLGEALVQMGLMDKVYNDSTGTYEYHINVDGGETALSQTQQLTQAIEALNKTFTITLEVDAKTPSTAAGIAGLIGYDPSAGGGLQIPVTADTSGFDADISAVTATEIPEKTAMILGDSSGADTAISNVNAAAIDTKTLTIGGEYSAAESAVNAVNNLTVNDKYMTIYATTVYSSIGTPGLGLRHGGIAGYAHGGIPVELAEAGSELLHFAGGGTMPIYNHGYYTVPPMTYVSPANTGTARSGGDVYIDLSGSSFVGTSRAEMDNWAETSLVPNLRKVLQDERAGYLR